MLERLARAKAYPYPIPDHCYLFERGRYRELDWSPELTEGRVPVIACGSNRSPVQLARKYQDHGHAVIPVQRAWLDDFDVVYAAHITSYGSIAAMLQHVPGTKVEVSITWLAEDLMARMDETEGRGFDYDLAALDDVTLETALGDIHISAYAYVYGHGTLVDAGAPVGIREIRAHGRPHRACTQSEILALVHDRLGGAADVDAFIHQNIDHPPRRRARERALQADAMPFAWPHLRIVPAGKVRLD